MDETFIKEMEPPWFREPPMTRELLVDSSVNGKWRFFCIDPWHSIHLGCGKTWIAGGVMQLQKLVPESNFDARIAQIGFQYREYCKSNKLDPIIRKIDAHTFGTAADPSGTWNKAAITSNFFLFLEDFCDKRQDTIQGDERLQNWVSFLQLKFFLYFFLT